MRDSLNAFLCQLVFGNVGGHRKTAQNPPLVSDMRHQLDLDVAGLAVCKLARPLVSDRMSLQHFQEMALDLPVRLLLDQLSHVLAENGLDGKTEKRGKPHVGEAATQVLIEKGGHRRHVVGEQAQALHALAQPAPDRADVSADDGESRQ